MERRKATVEEQDGTVHWKVKDATGALHWLLPGQIAKGIVPSRGTKLIIEHWPHGWYAIKQVK